MKRITCIGTGGTIAGTGTPGSPDYDPAVNGIGEILAQIPNLKDLATVSAQQMKDPQAVTVDNPEGFVNLTSSAIKERQWLLLAEQVKHALAGSDAVIVTHGTDTLEETALFLQYAVKTDKPVILVGAGRPTFLTVDNKKVLNPNNDGLRNFTDAIRVASDPNANPLDVMVVMNGKIHAAYDAWKVSGMLSTGKPADMFSSPDWWGRLGTVGKQRIFWERRNEALRDRYRGFKVDTFGVASLPYVPIFTQQIGERSSQYVQQELDKGVRAFVFEGSGQGSLTEETRDRVIEWSKTFDAAFVRSARVPAEVCALDDPQKPMALAAGSLSSMHAKVFLQLALIEISRNPAVPGESLRAKIHGLLERNLIFQKEPMMQAGGRRLARRVATEHCYSPRP